MKPGDIVLVRFPQTDLQASKLHPALIIAVAPGRYGDLLLALISSRIHQQVPRFDEVIDPTDADFRDHRAESPIGGSVGAPGWRRSFHCQCPSWQYLPETVEPYQRTFSQLAGAIAGVCAGCGRDPALWMYLRSRYRSTSSQIGCR